MEQFTVGQPVQCINIEKLSGNEVAPPLIMKRVYEVKGIALDSKGNQHLDVGLLSTYNYITSHETGEDLPNGTKIHWCHPSRFTSNINNF